MWIEDSANPSADGGPEGQPNQDGSHAKQLEKLNVSSGRVLIIDQFMLANGQLLDALPAVGAGEDRAAWAAANAAEIRASAAKYGGELVEAANGSWGVLRDPGESLFILGRLDAGDDPQLEAAREATLDARGNASAVGRVFIDTRCVVFVDASILADRDFLAEYRTLRQSRQDKAARDMLRNHGAAVRYGFNREGDELGVFRIAGGEQIALWPDVVEPGNSIAGSHSGSGEL